jgi:radical SAM superfamily enzyme YgiQ (UPF0313 family)
MKVTFIEPKPKFPGWSNFGWFKRVPLLGPLYLATILKRNGFEAEILKESIQKVNISKLEGSEVICFSAMSSQVPRAQQLLRTIKKTYPDKKVIVGGVHASFRPQDFSEADHIIQGEGENIIIDLVEGNIKEKIVRGTPVEDLDSLPFPDTSVIKNVKTRSRRYTPVSTSRGCPFDCNFCSATQMFGKKYRFRSPESVIRELQSAKNIDRIFFYDDNFCSNKERTKEILRKMIQAGITNKWWGEARVEIARDDELLKLMAEANNSTLAVGFESVNPKVLEYVNKGQKFEDIVKCVKKLKDFGIRIQGFFMSGTDYDDKNSYSKILRFIDKYEIDDATFGVITPYPGTEFYYDLYNNNRILTQNWGAYDSIHAVFKPKKMSAYDLQVGQLEAMVRFFNEKKVWFKFWLQNFLETFSMIRELRRAFKINEKYLEFLKKVDPRRIF